MADVVILSGARTPIGKFGGTLAAIPGTALAGTAIAEALRRAGLSGDDVDYTWMGQVVAAGTGQVPARQAAVNGGIPMTTPSNLNNKACLSGLNSIYLAKQMIDTGDAEVVVAGGMESMSQAPFLLPKGRYGYGYGNGELLDSLYHDGLFCAFDACAMGGGTERYAAAAGLAREPQDAFAAQSHERLLAAQEAGRLRDEIVTVDVPQRRGDPLPFDTDEGGRPGTTAESLGKLPGAFEKGGNVTAGNSSQISDGASAVVVTTREKADQLGVEPLAEIVSYGMVAGPDASLLSQPSRAASVALERAGLSVADIDLFEINEAFAAVALQSMADLSIPDDVVNVNGGAIAMGHPIGMSGNRLALTLAYELRRRGGGLGAAALCGGGGQGDGMIIRVP